MSNFFSKNATAKIISILFALVIWLYVMGEINPIITIEITNVPITILSENLILERGLVIKNIENETTNIRLRGRLDYVTDITRDEVVLTADLRDLNLGRNNVQINDNLMDDIEVSLFPETLLVELEEIIRVQKEIDLEITGDPKENFVLGQSQYSPTVVWIEGPESFVNRVDKIIARLEVENMSANITASLPLKAYDIRGTEVSGIDIRTEYIEASLLIDSKRTVRIIPNIEAKAAEGYEITDITASPSEITIIGQPEAISNVFAIRTLLVQREELSNDTELIVTLLVPDNGFTVSRKNTKVKIEVEKIAEKIISIDRENIIFSNLRDDLEIDKSNIPEKIEIKIVAIESFVDTLTTDDFNVIVNLEELGAGEYTIEPIIKTSFAIEQKAKELSLISEGFFIILIPATGESEDSGGE
ncbi:MAG: hypothetical protein LR001_04035 [Clostridiales bacterium]|nr:hypothetical protein [Clostridiales bacterium]